MRTSLDIMLLLIATNNTITMQLRLLLITEITLLAAVSIGAKHAHLRQVSHRRMCEAKRFVRFEVVVVLTIDTIDRFVFLTL